MKRKPDQTILVQSSTGLPATRYTPKPKGSWKKLVGSMKDCDLHQSALSAGAEWRRRMNKEGK